MRRLILTADDFGYDAAVNSAVMAAFQEGVLRYASLMVNRPGADEAAGLARANPGLGVGLHLELCAERPAYWGLRYAFSARDKAALEGEIISQIEAMLKYGIKPTHIDGHLNIHVHPVIFPMLVRLARRYEIPRLRLPSGELGPSLAYSYGAGSPRLSPSPLPYRLAIGGVFGVLSKALRRQGRGLNIPRTYGLLHSGLMTEDYLLWLIAGLPEGLTEIYFHPSSDPGSAISERPTATHQTITELRTLLSPRVRAALEETGVVLVCEAGAPPSGGGNR